MSRDYKTRKPSASKPEKKGSAFFGGFVGYALGLASAIGIWFYLNFAQNPFVANEKKPVTAEKNQVQPAPEVVQQPIKPDLPEESPKLTEEKSKFDFYKILPGIEEPEIDYSTRRVEEHSKSTPIITAPSEVTSKPAEISAQPTPPRPHIAPAIETAVVQPQPPIVPKSQPLQQQPQSQLQPQLQQAIAPQATTPGLPKEKIFLQVGAFRRGSDAENIKAQLALLGIVASIQPIELADKGMLYRVRIGPFNNKTDSDKIGASLRENGIETQIVKIQ